jgi:hypothetical protein
LSSKNRPKNMKKLTNPESPFTPKIQKQGT